MKTLKFLFAVGVLFAANSGHATVADAIRPSDDVNLKSSSSAVPCKNKIGGDISAHTTAPATPTVTSVVKTGSVD